MIADEVMSGFGRTGKWLATQHYGITPDIVTAAKGLTSGYMPLGTVIVSEPIARYFETHMLSGGLTYSGHPVCCAAAIANLAVYEEESIFENVQTQGAYLSDRLQAMREHFACVGDVRSIGLFSVIELVKDKATREPLAPYNGSSPEMAALAAHLKQNHLYAFTRFNMLWVCPPLIITEKQLGEGLDIIERGLALVDAKLEILTRRPGKRSLLRGHRQLVSSRVDQEAVRCRHCDDIGCQALYTRCSAPATCQSSR